MKVAINKFTQRMLKNANLEIEKVEIMGDKSGHLEFYISFKNIKTDVATSGIVEIKHPDLK